jgi:hypothetical protein
MMHAYDMNMTQGQPNAAAALADDLLAGRRGKA